MGWCDDPMDVEYNRQVRLPFHARHEILWREDGVYDLIVELGFNDDPVIPGRGSAIFLHVARADYAPTEGCVACALPDLLELLAAAKEGDTLGIEA
jgi:L,D-peptidoglycan transpeptidase YkuD (ErfK/YbiS/YcfS/YnhG family)